MCPLFMLTIISENWQIKNCLNWLYAACSSPKFHRVSPLPLAVRALTEPNEGRKNKNRILLCTFSNLIINGIYFDLCIKYKMQTYAGCVLRGGGGISHIRIPCAYGQSK